MAKLRLSDRAPCRSMGGESQSPSSQPEGRDSVVTWSPRGGRPGLSWFFPLLVGVLLTACAPTVKVVAPSEPITINLNIKLDADVRVRLEETAKEDIDSNPDVF
ncbi:MAG: YnbE family lipoprotein [Kiloniellales bacterium]